MSEEQTNFKVTDRRSFNADGSPREVPPEEKPEPVVSTIPAADVSNETMSVESAAPDQPRIAATPPEPADIEEEDEELPDADNPAGFVNFIMSIASNAASSLGMMEHPVTHKREVDLELAKHWIDILGMLQQKTRNNLAPQEEKILKGLLADLRMQYVSLTNSASPKSSSAFTGRDILGG